MSAQTKNKVSLTDNLADSICFIVLEKSFDLERLLELDVSQFMVLLQFLEKQAKEQEKQLKKSKVKGRR